MVVIDDFLPFLKDERTEKFNLLGAHTRGPEFWVCILEKAYAALYGSYDNIGCGGNIGDALTDLTGAPSELFLMEEFEGNFGGEDGDMGTINNAGGMNLNSGGLNQSKEYEGLGVGVGHHSSLRNKVNTNAQGDIVQQKKAVLDLGNAPDQQNQHLATKIDQTGEGTAKLWNLLRGSDLNKYIICATTHNADRICSEFSSEYEKWSAKNPNEGKEMFCLHEFGLIPSFAYTVLDVAEFNGEKLVRLRNIKSEIEWKGTWSDHSDKWNGVREELRTAKVADGNFYMSLEDFQNLFS